MAELYQLQEQEIPEAMGQLQESHNNLKKVADYCEGLYLQVRWMTKILVLIPELSKTDFHLQNGMLVVSSTIWAGYSNPHMKNDLI